MVRGARWDDAQRHTRARERCGDITKRAVPADPDDHADTLGEGGVHGRSSLILGPGLDDPWCRPVTSCQLDVELLHQRPSSVPIPRLRSVGIHDHQGACHTAMLAGHQLGSCPASAHESQERTVARHRIYGCDRGVAGCRHCGHHCVGSGYATVRCGCSTRVRRAAASPRRAGRWTSARTYDAMIAAVAIANQLPLYTCNPRDFQHSMVWES